MNTGTSTCMEKKRAITEEIQGINLHILAIGKHGSSSASANTLSQLKERRNELYQQVSAINNQSFRKRL